jgi:hypothetical protein
MPVSEVRWRRRNVGWVERSETHRIAYGYITLTSPTRCSFLNTLPPPGTRVISTALSPSHLAITTCRPEVAKNAGSLSGENELAAGAMLSCVLKPTAAPHSFPKTTITFLPSGDGIDLRTSVLHSPKMLMKYQTYTAPPTIKAERTTKGTAIHQARRFIRTKSFLDLDRAVADVKDNDGFRCALPILRTALTSACAVIHGYPAEVDIVRFYDPRKGLVLRSRRSRPLDLVDQMTMLRQAKFVEPPVAMGFDLARSQTLERVRERLLGK